MNPWTGTEAAPAPPAVTWPLPWVRTCQIVLVVLGLAYLLLGVQVAVGQCPDPRLGPPWGPVLVAFVGLEFVPAVGLGFRARWARILPLALGVWYICGCWPAAAALLYGMSRADVRNAFQS